jgi:uncharacterized 2Fe-2S/4Fe-4S cluster protein (DUF4445 family)
MALDLDEHWDGSGWVVRVSLAEPSLEDNTADADRLCRCLQQELGMDRIHIGLDLSRQLPALLRQSHYAVRCLVFEDMPHHGVLIHIDAGDSPAAVAGLAVDLGTTRVVIRLVDLETRETLAETSFDNPQVNVGPDVLARIHHTDRPSGLQDLQRQIIDVLNAQLEGLCGTCNLSTDSVYLFSVAGNTAMSHLFAGLPAHWMIREPYIPAANRFPLMHAHALGLCAGSNARVWLFPNVGSYFGGDLIAGLLFSGLHQRSETAILVDVGTNAEVVLGNSDWLMACAGAAGPALEGGMSRMGTTAAPGVIDRVRIDPQTGHFELHTIGELPPVGICGSGVIDLAAQLFLSGMIDIRGKLQAGPCGERFAIKNDLAHLILVPREQSGTGRDLCISQVDLDSLVRSKAAMYTILETLTGTMGMNLADLETFYVAGTFGSLIDPVSAITIGMIPDLPLERFQSLGNSSLGGATKVLTERGAVSEAARVREKITYLELNVNQDFMNRFSAAKFIPHTHKGRFPSVSVSK